jgi:hypothetical protein
MARISEDIRFYLPSDPYYFKVDNLPLQDLLKNDKRLQSQIDNIELAEAGMTIQRNGFLELKPFLDQAIPGTVTVNPGTFIGRVQRSSNGQGVTGSTLEGVYNGTEEMENPPTVPGVNGEPGSYNTGNPPNRDQDPAYSVGRTAVFNFPGGTIPIQPFSRSEFQSVEASNQELGFAPQGRIDIVGITTVNGAQDDPFIPGNADELNVAIGDGRCKLATVRGAGLVSTNESREIGINIGERFQTIGQPQDELNVAGKNPDGTITNDPRVGTYPMPDDVVNICFSRADIRDSLTEWAQSQRNASFFLPLAYVFVDWEYSINNPIPPSWLYDIRPFFRTAELTLAERQSLAAAANPSVTNPVITASYQEMRFTEEVNRSSGNDPLQQQLDTLQSYITNVVDPQLEKIGYPKIVSFPRASNLQTATRWLPNGQYYAHFNIYAANNSTNGLAARYSIYNSAGQQLSTAAYSVNHDDDGGFSPFLHFEIDSTTGGAHVYGKLQWEGALDEWIFLSGHDAMYTTPIFTG